MCTILLSINPQYVEKIFSGDKLYEYRRVISKKKIDKIVIYSTNPVKKVVGEVEVLESLQMQKEELWSMTKNNSGISKKFYNEYFRNKKVAGAYRLGKVKKYNNPCTLEDIGIKNAPQSYVYL